MLCIILFYTHRYDARTNNLTHDHDFRFYYFRPAVGTCGRVFQLHRQNIIIYYTFIPNTYLKHIHTHIPMCIGSPRTKSNPI